MSSIIEHEVPVLKPDKSKKTISELARELLYHVDGVPDLLALSQAAYETGWATSDLSRQGNNFFGQKATGKHDKSQRIKNTDGSIYRKYNDPEHSIRSYIHNLNTHPSYKEFRQKRFYLQRQKNMTPDRLSFELTNYLKNYSTNPEYDKKLREIQRTLKIRAK